MKREKPIYIADTLHNTIQISELEKKVISTQLFNRLHNISQNSTAYLTFPTNRTKRFEHSIGTMKLCGDIFYYGISNCSKIVLNNFFNDFKLNLKQEFIEKDSQQYKLILEDEKLDKLDHYENYNVNSCFYNTFIPHNIDNENTFLYLVIFQGIRLAALLHDIGHPPFSHITETAIKKCFDIYKNKKDLNSRQKNFIDIIKGYCREVEVNGKLKQAQLHEELGNKMAGKIFDNLMSKEKDTDFSKKYFNILVYSVAIYLLTERNNFFKQIHSIIDGAMDGDRLDYVSRDVINSGFELGRIEYSRLISAMVLCKYNGEYTFAPDIKVLNTTEDFFLRRWKLYKTIIYHHRVIKTDHLLQDSIFSIIIDYLEDDVEENIDHDDLTLPTDISGLWKPLLLRNSTKYYFDALIQWDDCWLLSVLKHYYFSNLVKQSSNKMLSCELEELLSNRKQFYSIIKGNNDFYKLNMVILQNIDIDFSKFNKEEIGDIDEKYYEIISIIEKMCKDRYLLKQGYLLNNIKVFIETFYNSSYNFNDLIKEMIDDLISEKYDGIIEQYFIEFKLPNFGLSKTPYIFNDDEVTILYNISNIGEILFFDGSTFPIFFLYAKFNSKFKYDEFISDLGRSIAKEFNKFFASIV